MVKAIVVGAAGRMGNMILRALHETPNIYLKGAVERKDHPFLGRDIGEVAGMEKWEVPLTGDLKEVISRGDVIIDFTNAESALRNFEIAAQAGKAAVIGATGFSGEQMGKVKTLARSVPCVLSPNMSVGVNLMFKFVADMAKILGDDFDVEVIEAHHRMKKDAPSGTAVKIGQVLAAALDRNFDEVGTYARKGLIGERKQKEIGMQTIRAGDIVGEHTVIFGGIGERLEFTHRAHSRDNFARGAIRAVAWVVKQKPGLYDMQDVLGLR
ncbi:MAG TPA: 4-hydroxy-tetrahydrodipicolinate reductase [Thermodesulfobacteriota bacterium]|nr:4-hydroxy-tetrahydrodipicolinate reductase [Thermodesulfobacteriota bacterium]